jgi:hypothetical protein
MGVVANLDGLWDAPRCEIGSGGESGGWIRGVQVSNWMW